MFSPIIVQHIAEDLSTPIKKELFGGGIIVVDAWGMGLCEAAELRPWEGPEGGAVCLISDSPDIQNDFFLGAFHLWGRREAQVLIGSCLPSVKKRRTQIKRSKASFGRFSGVSQFSAFKAYFVPEACISYMEEGTLPFPIKFSACSQILLHVHMIWALFRRGIKLNDRHLVCIALPPSFSPRGQSAHSRVCFTTFGSYTIENLAINSFEVKVFP